MHCPHTTTYYYNSAPSRKCKSICTVFTQTLGLSGAARQTSVAVIRRISRTPTSPCYSTVYSYRLATPLRSAHFACIHRLLAIHTRPARSRLGTRLCRCSTSLTRSASESGTYPNTSERATVSFPMNRYPRNNCMLRTAAPAPGLLLRACRRPLAR